MSRKEIQIVSELFTLHDGEVGYDFMYCVKH